MKNHRLMWVEETAVIVENTETGVFLTGHAVPVVRCKHGNYDPHLVGHLFGGDWYRCPGAGIGGDDGLSPSDSTRRTSDRIGGSDEK